MIGDVIQMKENNQNLNRDRTSPLLHCFGCGKDYGWTSKEWKDYAKFGWKECLCGERLTQCYKTTYYQYNPTIMKNKILCPDLSKSLLRLRKGRRIKR